MTKTTAAKIRQAQKTADRLANLINDLRHDLPEPMNSEQELASGGLHMALESAFRLSGELNRAATSLADKRTETQIAADNRVALDEEARENTRRRFGCTAD